jgi:hypothetical protein
MSLERCVDLIKERATRFANLLSSSSERLNPFVPDRFGFAAAESNVPALAGELGLHVKEGPL